LRRRFEQNQEDCTYTVLALLPTIRDEIIEALPVEQITEQLQQERQERLKRLGQSEAASSEYPSGPPSVTDDASTSSFVHASQMASSVGDNGLRTKRSKAQLWQEMKINCKSLGNATHRHKLTWLQAVTRALTLLYTLSLLNILTRIQLNLLGRRTYLSSVVSLANPQANMQSSTISLENRDDDNFENFYGNDFETNRKYLTFSWWLLHRGSKQIMERVTAAVKEVFGAVNIREDITMERLADLIMQVRKKIEGPTDGERRQMRWLSYLLPPQDEEQFVIRQASVPDSDDSPSPETAAVQDPMSADVHITSALRRLLDETSDLIDSPTFSFVLTRLLDAGFSNLIDHHVGLEAFKNGGVPTFDSPRITEVTDTKCKIAHILPVFCRQAHAIVGVGELDMGNEYMVAMDRVPDLEAFAAVIYSSNLEYELAEGDDEARAARVEQFAEPKSSFVESEIISPPAQSEKASAAIDAELAPVEVNDEVDTEAPSEQPPAPVDGAFESVWKKALAAEDGVKDVDIGKE
jgi:peroxin-3